MTDLNNLKIKIFADGANSSEIQELSKYQFIKGFTTNPTLMRKAGATNYENHCLDLLSAVGSRPISFEVLADDLNGMLEQAIKISSWGENVFCKIPVTNTLGQSTVPVIQELTKNKIKVNVTAVFSIQQVSEILAVLNSGVPSNISIFAGRLADTGVDATKLMAEAVEMGSALPMLEYIWASPRQLYNIFDAETAGCHIITATTDILNKVSLIGYDPIQYSLDTVKMFFDDSVAAGFDL